MGWSEDKIQEIWNKGFTVENYDPAKYRKDTCGAWIMRDHHGDDNHDYGWEVDHILPVSKGGGDQLDNLRPLHHRNNASKGDGYPHYNAVVTSEGTLNVSKEKSMTVAESIQQKIKQLYLK